MRKQIANQADFGGESYNTDENILAFYLKEISKIPLLSKEEEDQIARAAAAGSKAAQQKLVSSNLRFVVNVAKRYQGQGLPLPDLISEGNIGLMDAVRRYDVDKGCHFISYAVWWIRQAILKAICEKSRLIRLPLNRANELVQIEKARKYIGKDHCWNQGTEEIASLLNMDNWRVEELVNISKDVVSLEHPVSEEKNGSLVGDFVEDAHFKAPEEMIIESALKNDIETVLKTLNKKEAAVIRYRYGLGTATPMSLKEIGDHLNLTKERIRQIEKKALKRLQHPKRCSALASYVA